jgi:hypothetical protein
VKCHMPTVMLALLPQIALGGSSTAWQILQASKLASGGHAWDSVRSLEMSGTISVDGMTGHFTSYQDLIDAKFRNDFSLGPIRQSSGFDGKSGWTLDSNGDIAPHDSPSERRADLTQAYLAARDYWFPRRWPAVLGRVRTVTRGRSRYEVVRVAPKGGVPFQMWINGATHQISRIILPGAFAKKEVTKYEDYRNVHGLVVPFLTALSAGRPGNDQTLTVSRVAVNTVGAARLYQAPRQHLADYSFVSKAHGATIPFRFIGRHIYFPAEIAGHKYQFGLDTGGMDIITPAVAKAIGVRSEGSAQATGVGNKRLAVSFAKVPAVSIDSKLTLRNQLFVIVPLPAIRAVEGTRLDGVLGYELFKRFVISIDYAKRRLYIVRPADFDARSAGVAVPFTYDGRMPQVGGSLDGLPGRFDIDTGSRDALSVNSPFVKAHGLLQHYRATAPTVIGWGAGGAAHGSLARARELQLGEIAVHCPIIVLSTQTAGTDAERSVAGVIGNPILSRFTVTFDYGKQIVYWRPNSRYGRPFTYDRAGMWVNQRNGSFVVESVMAAGPARRAGLHPGDLIVSVNGRPTKGMQLAAFRDMLARSPAGTRVDLRVVRARRAHAIAVTLRDLVPTCKARER